jgi:hypothetical protein
MICVLGPCGGRREGAPFDRVLAAQRGCPMDGQRGFFADARADIPSALALMMFVTLWGFIACTAALYCISSGS